MYMKFHRDDPPRPRRCAICGIERTGVLGERCPDDGAVHVSVDLLDEVPLGGRHRLVERIAQGAFADVYVAVDGDAGRSIGHLVAIKRLQPHLRTDTEAVARFEREGELLERLADVPGVVRLVERGRTADGDPYLALEYLSGQTLEDVITSYGRLTAEAAGRVVLGILLAIDGVHRAGLVHRDLKPSNIIMIGVDEVARLRLLDFGIAHDPARSDTRLTAPTRTLGTPNYMPPEQWSSSAVDERADLYSIGVIFYHLLTGRLPFDGDDIQVAHQHRTAPPEPFDPGLNVPAGIGVVVERAMAKVPELRYQSAGAFYDALAVELGLPGVDGLLTTIELTEGSLAARASKPPAEGRSTRSMASPPEGSDRRVVAMPAPPPLVTRPRIGLGVLAAAVAALLVLELSRPVDDAAPRVSFAEPVDVELPGVAVVPPATPLPPPRVSLEHSVDDPALLELPDGAGGAGVGPAPPPRCLERDGFTKKCKRWSR